MTSQQILQSDLLDILFEGRNKAYGAYSLRRGYNLHLIKAIGITSSLVIALLFFGGQTKRAAPEQAADEGYILTQVHVPPPVVEPPKMQPPPTVQQPVKTDLFLDRVKVVDRVVEPIAKQESLNTAVPGAAKLDGPPANSLQPPQLPSTGGSNGPVETVVEKPEPAIPNRQPQFPGGTEAWLKFLGRYLIAPSDLDAGEKRSVLVKFSVDEEGVVTNFVVVQSGGADFDNEVIRVLKKMPRWLPAIQAGKPAAVSFTQPVTFQAQD